MRHALQTMTEFIQPCEKRGRERESELMLGECWPTVYNFGSTLTQHWESGHDTKYDVLNQCCYNVGPASVTLAQHWNNIWWGCGVRRALDPDWSLRVWRRGQGSSCGPTTVQLASALPFSSPISLILLTAPPPSPPPSHHMDSLVCTPGGSLGSVVAQNGKYSVTGFESRPARIFLLGAVHILYKSGGPGAVVKAVCLGTRGSRVRAVLWHSSFKEAKHFHS